jgi:translation initiation factor 2B subunit (eIF-2B alpha/beta/delta family)
VVTAGAEEEKISARFAQANDDYGSIMVKALADRIAEALAERMNWVGAALETEEMEAAEVDSAPPRGVAVRNVYFEETPAELITGGIIHEGGA